MSWRKWDVTIADGGEDLSDDLCARKRKQPDSTTSNANARKEFTGAQDVREVLEEVGYNLRAGDASWGHGRSSAQPALTPLTPRLVRTLGHCSFRNRESSRI